jgi:hypothetical protein
MGISPLYWGRQAWHFIHFIALNYPEQPTQRDKDIYIEFLHSLPQVLPCPICGSHFMDFIVSNEPRLDNRSDLFWWTVDAHNEVNKRYDKKVLTYEEAYNEVMKNANGFIVSDFNKDAINKVNHLMNKINTIKKKIN